MQFFNRKQTQGKKHSFSIAGSLPDGFKALIRLRSAGPYGVNQIWDAQAILDEPARQHVKLFYFPAPQADKSNPDEAEAIPAASKPFAIICPGGAYATVGVMSEGFPTAAALNGQGYPAFVLDYRTGLHARFPAPLDDLAQAIRFIADHADQLGVSMPGYSVWGFSAGGHLSACFGTERIGASHYSLPRPSTLMLAYPLITMNDPLTHRLSRRLLLGKDFTPDDQAMTSIEHQITSVYPPTYIWHCQLDPVVDSRNSELLHDVLSKNGVTCRYQAFDCAAHGQGLGRGTPVEGWFDQALDFWRQRTVVEHPIDLNETNETT